MQELLQGLTWYLFHKETGNFGTPAVDDLFHKTTNGFNGCRALRETTYSPFQVQISVVYQEDLPNLNRIDLK